MEAYDDAKGIPAEARLTKLSGLEPVTSDEGKVYTQVISGFLDTRKIRCSSWN